MICLKKPQQCAWNSPVYHTVVSICIYISYLAVWRALTLGERVSSGRSDNNLISIQLKLDAGECRRCFTYQHNQIDPDDWSITFL